MPKAKPGEYQKLDAKKLRIEADRLAGISATMCETPEAVLLLNSSADLIRRAAQIREDYANKLEESPSIRGRRIASEIRTLMDDLCQSEGERDILDASAGEIELYCDWYDGKGPRCEE